MIISFDELPEHIKSKVKKCDSGCWIFNGNDPSSNGYQRCYYNGHRYMAHRIIYELLTGKDIRKWQLDHLCEKRACVNPEHLDPVTPKVNCKRKFRRRKRPINKG